MKSLCFFISVLGSSTLTLSRMPDPTTFKIEINRGLAHTGLCTDLSTSAEVCADLSCQHSTEKSAAS